MTTSLTTRLVGAGHRTAITAAFDLLPRWLAEMLAGTHFFCGVSPIFAGVHLFEDASYGRSYKDTAHVAYHNHMRHRPVSDRGTVVVLPVVETPDVIIHELGHVLDDLLDYPPAPEPVSWYAEVSRAEAFAEAFTMAHVPGYITGDSSVRRLVEYKQMYSELAPYFKGDTQ